MERGRGEHVGRGPLALVACTALPSVAHAADAGSLQLSPLQGFVTALLAVAAIVALAPHTSSAHRSARFAVGPELLAALALLVASASGHLLPAAAAFALVATLRALSKETPSVRSAPWWCGPSLAIAALAWRADVPKPLLVCGAALGVVLAGGLLVVWVRRVRLTREPFAVAALLAWAFAVFSGIESAVAIAMTRAPHLPVAWPLAVFALALVALHVVRTHDAGDEAEASSIAAGDLARSLDSAHAEIQALERSRNDVLTHTTAAVREPVGLLLATLDTLLRSSMLNFQARGPVEQAVRLGKEASFGVSAIADATGLRNGTVVLEPMAVDLRAVVDEALDTIRRRQEIVAPTFHIDAESDLPYVFADSDRLTQVLTTLFSRAAMLSPDGATHVRIVRLKELVQLTLEDRRTSCEPDASLLSAPALHDRRGTTSHIDTLRLWIAGRIVQLHGYPVTCAPRSDGAGFRWTIRLPRSKVDTLSLPAEGRADITHTMPPPAGHIAAAVQFTVPSPTRVAIVPGLKRSPLAGALVPASLPKLDFGHENEGPHSTRPRISLIPPASVTRGAFDSGGGFDTIVPASLKPRSIQTPQPFIPPANPLIQRPRVLVADDDPVVRNVIAAQLAELDVDVTMAVDGVDALAHIQSQAAFDLVVSDVLMPRLTGLQLCKIVRETHTAAELPFVLMSSNSSQDDVTRAFESGASDFMVKPTVKAELLQRIATHLRIASETTALTRFVPREFLRLLGRDRVADVRLGDHVAKDLTILFADIRGFTSMSESLGPAGTFQFLNDCLSRIAPHIHANGGFIDKYIGDALMALFPTNAIGAVRAAVAIQNEVSAYNAEHQLVNDESEGLAIGVGIFRGPTMLGTIGEPRRFEATVISDAVNVAARLEALTRRLGVRVLIGESVLTDLSDATFALRPLGRVVARGRGEPVAVWELLDAESENGRREKLETMESFLTAIEAFDRGSFSEAIAAFDDVLERSPNDGPSWVYQQACQRFLTNEIPFGFRGALDFGGEK